MLKKGLRDLNVVNGILTKVITDYILGSLKHVVLSYNDARCFFLILE